MVESDLLQGQIAVDPNNTPDTNFTVGQHHVLVTMVVSIDVGKLLMLI
jgi:hypothetical protein